MRTTLKLPKFVVKPTTSEFCSGVDVLHLNRLVDELIESGLEAREQERRHFFELADRLASADNPEEQSRLKAELARRTFWPERRRPT